MRFMRMRAEAKERIRAELEVRHRDLAKDFACSLALQNMSSDERDTADNLASTRTFTFYEQATEALKGIAQNVAWGVAARILGPTFTNINEWRAWGQDVVDTATTVLGSTSALSQQVTTNGYQLSRAAYFYAQVCLKPPG